MLNIKTGEILLVGEESGGWCWGTNSKDEDGWFPNNFIKFL